ncbi:hypothetical protein JRQ81_015660 [Phrynocephalus forsythii]|uniref:Uncharacterized protein n=1 Tax=Phrynocephalus forsythii TaxID=171643 RepID=A0A9Q0XV03_9SAUR|nr:hypothetical protein JRQ81_015660 [Phrynocephalus forsythii]
MGTLKHAHSCPITKQDRERWGKHFFRASYAHKSKINKLQSGGELGECIQANNNDDDDNDNNNKQQQTNNKGAGGTLKMYTANSIMA